MVVKNPDLKKYDEVSKAVEQNDGYYPCLINKNKDTRCMCKEFLATLENVDVVVMFLWRASNEKRYS